MRARKGEEPVQGVRGRRHMRARQAEDRVQGVRGLQHMCARQAEEHVQGVRGYQRWLGDAAALGTAACNHDLDPLVGSHRGAVRSLADFTSTANSAR